VFVADLLCDGIILGNDKQAKHIVVTKNGNMKLSTESLKSHVKLSLIFNFIWLQKMEGASIVCLVTMVRAGQ
jgi:hypothetical protein